MKQTHQSFWRLALAGAAAFGSLLVAATGVRAQADGPIRIGMIYSKQGPEIGRAHV